MRLERPIEGSPTCLAQPSIVEIERFELPLHPVAIEGIDRRVGAVADEPAPCTAHKPLPRSRVVEVGLRVVGKELLGHPLLMVPPTRDPRRTGVCRRLLPHTSIHSDACMSSARSSYPRRPRKRGLC